MKHYKNLSLNDISETINGVTYLEAWSSIAEYDRYLISTFGRVKSLYTNIILRQCFDKDKYLQVRLYKERKGKTKRIHRLVAAAFLPNPDNKPVPNHLNGVKDDNFINNLEWSTHSENQIHSFDCLNRKSYWSGKTGSQNKDSKRVLCITNGVIYGSVREAERVLKCSSANISRICNGIRKQENGFTFRYV